MIIRHATYEDTAFAGELAKEAYKELQAPVEVDEVNFIKQTRQILQSPMSCTFVAVASGRVVGTIQAVIIPAPWNPGENTACLLHWFVKEKYRKSSTGLKLFRNMERWARKNGATHVLAGLSANSDARLEKYFDKKGYKLMNTQYIREIK
jgi:predicted N-acetyltransferase YhbS